MKMANKKLGKNRFSAGSALILTVVLTTLLAIIAVVFVMMTRVDKITTSAISENRELDFAVEAAIARISRELVLDVPRKSGPCCTLEYYDYPDPCNAWLASLEPDVERGASPQQDVYYWRQISDVTGYLRGRFATRYVKVDPEPPRGRPTQDFIREYPPIRLDAYGELDAGAPDDGMFGGVLGGEFRGQLADTDGDGIADAKWFPLDNITTSKGKTIYAAIRIIDNSAMLNVNTAYKFDPCEVPLFREKIDGSSQMQINLDGLARLINPGDDDANEIHFGNPYHLGRCGISGDPNWKAFQDGMIWRIESPAGGYLPFDISDELEMRYRFCITSGAQTRLESLWDHTIGLHVRRIKDEPFAGGTFGTLEDWQRGVTEPYDPNIYRRHLLTTYNFDRIIDPNGDKMININEDTTPVDVDILYSKLLSSIGPIDPNDPNLFGPVLWQIKSHLAQLAANMIDFADENTNVTVFRPMDPCLPQSTYYGFEAQPFITEIGMKDQPGSIFCAVELYNPFSEHIDLSDFEIELTYEDSNSSSNVLTVPFGGGDRIDPCSYFVVSNRLSEFDIYPQTRARQDPRLRFFGNWQPPGGRKPPVVDRPPVEPRKPPKITARPGGDGIVFLRRRVVGTGEWIYVDRQVVDPDWVPRKDERYFGRDDRGWHVAYQTLVEDVSSSYGTLGGRNVVDLAEFTGHNFSFYLPNPIRPPYRTMPWEDRDRTKLLTVGDITRILTIGHGITPESTIGQKLLETDKSQEEKVRLNLQNPLYRNIFQYLTVFDPSTDEINNDGDRLPDGSEIKDEEDEAHPVLTPEFKVPGRININTAPWYVIAQLPWMQDPFLNMDDPDRMKLAQAIVAYRDKLRLPTGLDYHQNDTSIVPDPNSRFLATGIFGLREDPGFASIGELNFVVASTLAGDNAYRIQRFEPDGNDLGRDIGHPGFPDLTTDGPELGDGIVDDFEERDIIFSRISNLVTVRSDVFTAYILVRIGTDGPQKRAIAILDRSDVYPGDVYPGEDKVRLVALHYVPDPR